MQQQILYLSILSLLSKLLLFSARFNSLYDVVMLPGTINKTSFDDSDTVSTYQVSSVQLVTDKSFLKIATFLHNSLIKN